MGSAKFPDKVVRRSSAVVHKRRLLTWLNRILAACVVLGAVGLAVFGFLLARWVGLSIALAGMALIFGVHQFASWVYGTLLRFLTRRALLRALAEAKSNPGTAGFAESNAWIITRDRSVAMADSANRRMYFRTRASDWIAISSDEIKHIDLQRSKTYLGRVKTMVVLSNVYAGSGTEIELEVADGDAEKFISTLRRPSFGFETT